MTSIPIYITNRNLLSPIRGMIDYLSRVPGAEPVIVDCESTYPPLLEWYEKSCPAPVKRLTTNQGPRAAWQFVDWKAPYFVYSDGDFDLTGIPLDCLDVLKEGLIKFPNHLKAGFSIRTDDLPDGFCKGAAIAQESRFHRKQLDERFYECEIDCAFAMHRSSYELGYWGEPDGPIGHFGPSLYAQPPYQMRHLSWYVTPETLTEEWQYHLGHAADRGVVWTPIVRDWLRREGKVL